jgi:hypothetical protein
MKFPVKTLNEVIEELIALRDKIGVSGESPVTLYCQESEMNWNCSRISLINETDSWWDNVHEDTQQEAPTKEIVSLESFWYHDS